MWFGDHDFSIQAEINDFRPMIMTKKPEIIETSRIIMKNELSLTIIMNFISLFFNLKSENKIFGVWTFNFLIFSNFYTFLHKKTWIWMINERLVFAKDD